MWHRLARNVKQDEIGLTPVAETSGNFLCFKRLDRWSWFTAGFQGLLVLRDWHGTKGFNHACFISGTR